MRAIGRPSTDGTSGYGRTEDVESASSCEGRATDASEVSGAHNGWPQLRGHLYMWTQIVGKIRMAHTPMLNHWWQVTLYLTPRGLTTSSIPDRHDAVDMEFEFSEHVLRLGTGNGMSANVNLSPKPVVEFHGETFDAMNRLGTERAIRAGPNEVEPTIPFAEDYLHASYHSEAVRLFWHQLLQADRLLNAFRSYSRGNVSPVHFGPSRSATTPSRPRRSAGAAVSSRSAGRTSHRCPAARRSPPARSLS